MDGELKDNRHWLVVLLLSCLTLGIYGIYLVHVQARDTNIACEGDGKHTGGVLKLFLLGLITLGIYIFVWDFKIVSRWQNYAEDNGYKPKYPLILHVFFSYVLAATGILALVASILRLSAFNQVCEIYNEGGATGSTKATKGKQPPNPADNLWGWRDSPSGKL